MRFKKTIIFCAIILTIFLTYLFFHDNRLNYVVIGDSLAAGQNPYGEIGYGYADYIKDYLEKENLLKEYVKGYAVSGYTTENVLDDLKNNKKIEENDREINIRKVLRESDLVTISIGANDFMKDLKIDQLNLENPEIYMEKIDDIMNNIDKTLTEIRKYAKKEILMIGYYNPFPLLFRTYEKELDRIFQYADTEYEKICSKHTVQYISIYQVFKENSDFLPNPFDIHPNLQGYEAIANLLITNLEKNK